MSKKVILISGKARSGKDTLAKVLGDYLKEQGKEVLITHYADSLKYICETVFKWDGKKDEKGRQLLIDIGANPSFNFQQEYSELKAMCGDTAEELKELELAISEIKENIVQEVKPTKKKKQKTELDPDVFIL